MNLRDRLVNYTKEYEQPAIVTLMISAAKSGVPYVIVDRYELNPFVMDYLKGEGLEISYHGSEHEVKVYWGHWRC